MINRIPPTEKRSRSGWAFPSQDSTGFNPITDIEAFAKKQREDAKSAVRWENDGGK